MGYSLMSLHGLVFILALIIAIIAIFKKPFLGVLIYYTMSILKLTLCRKGYIWLYDDYRILLVLAIATIISWFLHRRSEGGKKTIFAPQVILMFAFLGVACLSRIWAGLKPIFDLDTTTLAKHAIVLFIAVNVIGTKKKMNAFIWVLVLATAYVGFDAHMRRLNVAVPVWWADKNDFALSLLAFLPLAFGLFWLNKSVFAKAMAGLSAVIITVAVVSSHSRGGFTAMLIILILMIIFGKNRLRKVLFCMPIGLYLFSRYTASVTQRLGDILGYESEATAIGRFEAWEAGINMITRNPILGVGAGNFKYRFAEYASYEVLSKGTRLIRSAHNMFIDVGATTGLLGLAIFLAILFKSLKDLWIVRGLSKDNPEMRYFNEWVPYMAISIIGFCVAGAFLSAAYGFRLCVLIALVVALKKIAKKELNVTELEKR